MENLFAYGTLMCADIMEEVAGCRLSHGQAILSDYCRRAVKGEHYPAMIPQAGEHVEGLLYRDVPERAWERLDRFEGEMYARRTVFVETREGDRLPAQTYVLKPEYGSCLSDAEWDYAEFLRSGKTAFRARYKGYRSL